jgi:flavin-binding protein dodecin
MPKSPSVHKKIEIVGTSAKSFADAAQNAVARASKSVRKLEWFEVTEMRGRITNGKVSQYQVKLKIGFRLED